MVGKFCAVCTVTGYSCVNSFFERRQLDRQLNSLFSLKIGIIFYVNYNSIIPLLREILSNKRTLR